MGTIAFIPEIINKDWFSVYVKLGIVAFAWLAVLVAILWDLHYGIIKAKSIGEMTSSEGYKRTVKKVCYYWATLTFALLFDSLIPITYYLPFPLNITPVITLIGALGLILTEYKSVRESADDKLRRKTDAAMKDVAMLMLSKKDNLEEYLEQFVKEQKLKEQAKTKKVNNSEDLSQDNIDLDSDTSSDN